MNKQQQGLTMISWLIVLVLVAMLTTIVFRVGPMYMDYYKVASVLESMEIKEKKMTNKEVRKSLAKRLDINSISFIKKDNISTYKAKNSLYVGKINIDYQVKEKFFDQIYLVGDFHLSTDKN